MFKDKVYDEMDDVSRMFEPFQYRLNDELSEFPDKIEIKPEDLLSTDLFGGLGTNMPEIIVKEARSRKLDSIINNVSTLLSDGFFKFEIEDLEDGEEVAFDAEKLELSHKIFLVKDKIAYDEKQLEERRKNNLLNSLKRSFNRNRDINKGRFNEIADIYGAEEVKSERSYAAKVSRFCEHMEKMLDDKTLDIRDADLCDRFIKWIVLYVQNGNLAALNNLTRIKIITHEKRPIYSIEEKEV